MRYPASEKLEIIRTVESSHLPASDALPFCDITKHVENLRIWPVMELLARRHIESIRET